MNLFKLIAYADDSTLATSLCLRVNNSQHRLCFKNITDVILNSELERLSKWLLANELKLNVGKTKYMIFHNRQFNLNNIDIPKLRIDGIEIERLKEFSFLGIVINEYANWSSHINHISKKISRTLGVMTRLKKLFLYRA